MSGPRSGIHRRLRPPEAIPLDALASIAGSAEGVRRRDLVAGDRVVVSTRNSVYSLSVLGDGSFEVSGGWFEREGRGLTITRVLGCTVGGHALFTDLIAAPGLFIEFGDGLRTTRVRTVRRIAAGGPAP
jgi:hypothetical protein